MTQMNEFARSERAPSREFHVDALSVKALRSKLGLSQPRFAKLLHVDVGTLRHWEQGRRDNSAAEDSDFAARIRTMVGATCPWPASSGTTHNTFRQ
jgi:DNA-binding transcriptional regulator YiaG